MIFSKLLSVVTQQEHQDERASERHERSNRGHGVPTLTGRRKSRRVEPYTRDAKYPSSKSSRQFARCSVEARASEWGNFQPPPPGY